MAQWKLKLKHNNPEVGIVPITLVYTTESGAEISKTVNVGPTENVYSVNEFAIDGGIDLASLSYSKTVTVDDKIINIADVSFGGLVEGLEDGIAEGYVDAGTGDGETQNDFIPTVAQIQAVQNAWNLGGKEPTWAAFANMPEWAYYDVRPDIEDNNVRLRTTPLTQDQLGETVQGGIFCWNGSSIGAVYFRSVLLGTLPYYAFWNYSKEGSGVFLQAMNVEGKLNGWHMYGNHLVNGRVFGQSLPALEKTDEIIDLSNGATNSSVLTITFTYDYYPMSTTSTPPKGKFYVDDMTNPVNTTDRTFIRVKLADGPHKIKGVPKTARGIEPVTFGIHNVNMPYYNNNQLMIVAIRGYANCRRHTDFKGIRANMHLYNDAVQKNFMQPNSLFELAVENPAQFQQFKDGLKGPLEDEE